MNALRIFLFGKFHAQYGEQEIAGLEAAKVQELFSYLLLYRGRPHHRETLATLLWGDSLTAQSKKYLRQTLWQLQTVLDAQIESADHRVLLVEPDWVSLNSETPLQLDVAEFERALAVTHGIPGRQLDAQAAQILKDADCLYQGDLLEGCYQDWCLFERERHQNMYLTLLDKLIDYCLAQSDYETGLTFGARVLRFDRARERTHWQMMRLHLLAGDRTAALRQYERCVAALEQELGVKPAERTVALYEQIRADQSPAFLPETDENYAADTTTTFPLPHVLGCLKQIQTTLTNVQHLVQRDIQTVEQALNGPR